MPIDVASGDFFSAWHDVELPGVVPLIFRRFYHTSYLQRSPSVLGPGWSLSFLMTLKQDLEGFTLKDEDGGLVAFDDPDDIIATGGVVRCLDSNMELSQKDGVYRVVHWHHEHLDVETFVFRQGQDGTEWPLEAIEHVSGNRAQLRYDSAGRLTEVTQSLEQRSLLLRYSVRGLLDNVALRVPNEVPLLAARYDYDDLGRLIAVTDPTDKAIRYEYDTQGHLVAETNRTDGAYRMRYDTVGKCVQIGRADGTQRQTLEIDETTRITRSIDSMGRTITYHWNEKGQVLTTISPTGAREENQYDEHGRIIAVLDPLNRATEYHFNESGDQIAVTDISGVTVKTDFNRFHLPVRVVTPDGATWTWDYDDEGQLITFTNPVGGRWTYTRSGHGVVIEATTPSGQHLHYSYGPDWRSQVISDQYSSIRREFDRWGNVVAEYDAQGLLRSYKYDVLGRLTNIIEADDSETVERLDACGSVTESIDANSNSRRFLHNPYGDLLEEIDPLGYRVRWEYDSEGRMRKIFNPKGEFFRYEYDDDDTVVEQQAFDGTVTRFESDVAGQLLKVRKANGSIIEYERDGGGRVVATRCSDGSEQRYEYNWANQVTAASSADADITFEYDLLGNVVAETQSGRRIDYRLDQESHLLGQKMEGSTVGPLAFEYDVRGRLKTVRQGLSSIADYEYDTLDRLVTRRVPNATESFNFDLRRRVQEQVVRDRSSWVVVRREYSYDRLDSLRQVKDSLRGDTTYEYDAGERLTSVSNSRHGAETFRYDSSNNLTSRNSLSLSYGTGDRLLSAGERHYDYDANGNLAARTESGASTHYHYDVHDRLRVVEHPNGTQTTFGYDAVGRRVWKEHQGRRTVYYWAKVDLIAEEAGEEKTEYLIGLCYPMARWRNGHREDVVTSHVAMPYELLDERGSLAWSGEYDPFGRLLQERGPGGRQPLRLPGQYHDEEIGLHYNGARYYDPDVGRFTSPDPLALHGGLNTYRYAPNPINWIDPFGLKCGKKHRHITYVVRVPPNTGPVVYVGRASGPHGMSDADILKRRQATHRSKNPNRKKWELELDRGGLTSKQARGREQILFDTHGGEPRPRGSDPHAANAPNPNNSSLLNIDNPINPESDNRASYLRAGRRV